MDAYERELMERGVSALEKLSADPVIQMETGPPVCPFCDRMNPNVRVEESEATGPLAEFVIQAQCQHCNKVFFGIPLQWSTCRNIQEVQAVISERAELGGYVHNGN